MVTPATNQLLQAVLRRLRINQLASSFALWLIGLGCLYGVLLLVSRCLGLAPELANWKTLLLVPALSLLMTLALEKKLTAADAARHVDRFGNTKDLFLTFTTLESSCGEYQPIVSAQAEVRAGKIQPESAAPIAPGRRVGYGLALLAGLVLGVFLLPQWDPWGRVAQSSAERDLVEKLKEERAATRTRVAQIKKDTTELSAKSKAESTVDEIKKTLKQARPQEQKSNLEKLNIHQADAGNQWRQLGAAKLKSLLAQNQSLQDFGGARMQKLDKWTEQLKNGDTQLIKQEVNELAQLARQMAAEKDPAKKAELCEMKERLKDLERFASERAGSPEAAAAIRRAMRQMEAADKQGMDENMMKDLAESLELSQLEMEQMAEAARDLQQLEKALKTMKMAKQLNEEGQLDGEAAQSCQTMEDYAELYKQMMAETGGGGDQEGDGEGMGGRGFGKGGKAEENEAAKTAFKDETSQSAVDAGKSLLTMKSRGMSDEGTAQKEYRDQVEKVRQSVSEAILQEQIPPGYHDSIRAFFDSGTNDSSTVDDGGADNGTTADGPASP